MIVQITCAKVGHRQAPFKQKPDPQRSGFCFAVNKYAGGISELTPTNAGAGAAATL
jgi:hypothetical protein